MRILPFFRVMRRVKQGFRRRLVLCSKERATKVLKNITCIDDYIVLGRKVWSSQVVCAKHIVQGGQSSRSVCGGPGNLTVRQKIEKWKNDPTSKQLFSPSKALNLEFYSMY